MLGDRTRRFVLVLLCLWVAPLALQRSAWAQQSGDRAAQPATDPTAQRFEILPTPYLWFPWTSMDVTPGNRAIPSASTTIGPGSLISHLTWVPFMGEVEFRYGPYGLIADYIHTPLKAGVSTRDVLFSGATSGVTIDTGTAMFLYRVMAQPDQHLDVGAGVRAWGFDGDISLNSGLAPAVVISNGMSWADPMLALRYSHGLGDGFSATVYGDVGGFGVGAHVDWQLIATVDYAAAQWIDLHAGFRTLNFDYTAARAEFNVHMYGPILGGTIHF